MPVLVIEDERGIADFNKEGLEEEGQTRVKNLGRISFSFAGIPF